MMPRVAVWAFVLWCGTILATAAERSSPGEPATFFEFEVKGRRVAFVCDRSGSMAEPDGKPLAAAKAGLMASLEALGASQQFHLFFYSDRVTVYTPPGGPGRPMFADDDTLRGVRRFVGGMAASGGTRHAEALAAALAVAPDEIFFLSDGEARDDLEPHEFERLTAQLGRTRLYLVQFSGGDGATPSPRLAKLAATSGGGSRVIDPTGAQ
jgi:LmbE family N-acetylglucosaminyl deacetylase